MEDQYKILLICKLHGKFSDGVSNVDSTTGTRTSTMTNRDFVIVLAKIVIKIYSTQI